MKHLSPDTWLPSHSFYSHQENCHTHLAARQFKKRSWKVIAVIFVCLVECTPAVCWRLTCMLLYHRIRCMPPTLTRTIVYPILIQCAHSNWCFLNAPLSLVWNRYSECLFSSCFFLLFHRPCSKLPVNIVTLADWTSLPLEQHMDVWHWEALQVCQHVFMSAYSSENFFFFYFFSLSPDSLHPSTRKYLKMKTELVYKVWQRRSGVALETTQGQHKVARPSRGVSGSLRNYS